MAFVIKSICNFYQYAFITLRDPRSDDKYFVQDSPLPVLSILAAYTLLCKFGPVIMKSRKAFELYSVMMIYNLIQITTCTYYASQGVYYLLWKYKYNFSCQPVDYSTTEHGMAEINLGYVYFLLKIIDLFDTLFIVLKKKNSQLSFLHCYHHGGMLLAGYCGAKWVSGGPNTMIGIVNTYVHSIMYFYYFLTSLKPELKQSIWWKKHITQIQLAQFSFLAVHFFRGIIARDCDYPKIFLWILFIQNFFLLCLFGDFYRKVYLTKKKQ